MYSFWSFIKRFFNHKYHKVIGSLHMFFRASSFWSSIKNFLFSANNKNSGTFAGVIGTTNYNKRWISLMVIFQLCLGYGFLVYFVEMYHNDWVIGYGKSVMPFKRILVDSLYGVYLFLFNGKDYPWNFMLGISLVRRAYFLTVVVFFICRDRLFLDDVDNIWLMLFLKKSVWKNKFLFLNRNAFFNELPVFDQQLIKEVIGKNWVFLYLLLVNLFFLKTFNSLYFFFGVFITLYALFLQFLVLFMACIFCNWVIKGWNLFEPFPSKYKKNLQQYFTLILKVGILFNFLLTLVFMYGCSVSAEFLMDFMSILYFALTYFFIVVSGVLAAWYVLFGIFYMVLFYYFGVNAHNLGKEELLLQKSKVLFAFCFVVFYVMHFLYWFYFVK